VSVVRVNARGLVVICASRWSSSCAGEILVGFSTAVIWLGDTDFWLARFHGFGPFLEQLRSDYPEIA
jgi:hypothetical protein